MKSTLFLSMFLLSMSSFAYERDAEGSAYRTLTEMSDCGSWGYNFQLEQAKKRAQSFANRLCWGVIARRITEFKNVTECTEVRGEVLEKVTSSARFSCNFPHYKTPPNCGDNEFTCYTNWGNLPYCSAGGECSDL